MVIVVDFDGTVVTHEYPSVGKEVGAVSVLKRLIAKGHQLVLFTMRDNKGKVPIIRPEGTTWEGFSPLDDAINWFRENDIPLYGVQSNPDQHKWTSSPKAYGQIIIDDAALGCPLRFDSNLSSRPFVDWIEVEKLLEKRGLI